MGEWLLQHGLDAKRLILEDQSLSTIENAEKTLDLLNPQVSALAIISSDYHVARGSLLFEATALMKKLDVHVVSNCASPAPDKVYTNDYLRGWQMYNMLQLLGENELLPLSIFTRNSGFSTIAQKWYGLRKMTMGCA